tara:strand:+ start:2813 stop:3223 length:411 start_codon:yes stop_codon:yes gene_type:complete
MAALYDSSFCLAYQDFFSICEPSSYVAVSYSHPVIDYCIENEVLMACDANHEVGAFDNPFYASLHNWFVPTDIWNKFQQLVAIPADKPKKNELIDRRRNNITYEKRRYIRKHAKRVKKALEESNEKLNVVKYEKNI